MLYRGKDRDRYLTLPKFTNWRAGKVKTTLYTHHLLTYFHSRLGHPTGGPPRSVLKTQDTTQAKPDEPFLSLLPSISCRTRLQAKPLKTYQPVHPMPGISLPPVVVESIAGAVGAIVAISATYPLITVRIPTK